MDSDQRHCPNCGQGVLGWNFVCPKCNRIPWEVWRHRRQRQRRIKSFCVLLSLLLGGIASAAFVGRQFEPSYQFEPMYVEPPATPPKMVRLVRLTNGSVLHANTVRTEGEVVSLELPDLGEMTFLKSEVASIEEVAADRLDQKVAQAGESQAGLVYVNGQWTTPATARYHRPRESVTSYHYPTTEEGLAEAQRALERAIRSDAAEDIQQLKETIQRIRTVLARQREETAPAPTVRTRKTKLELATEANARAIEQASVGMESGEGKTVMFQQLPVCYSYSVDLNTGETVEHKVPCR